MLRTALSSSSHKLPNLILSGDLAESRELQILVLDDERFDRHRMVRLCSGLEVATRVSHASSLAKFREIIKAQTFDLVILDYVLPDGSGLDALEALRLSPGNVNAATIMITGQGEDDVAAEARRIGCGNYLTKDSLTENGFRRAVTQALRFAQPAAEPMDQGLSRADLETLTGQVASQVARELKPMVSRMLRQMRNWRANPDEAGFEALHTTCIDVWETLVELQRSDGSDLTPPVGLAARDDPHDESGPHPRPPSPFSKGRH
ncbi:MAG: response regulator [Pseudomonadota bacterium]